MIPKIPNRDERATQGETPKFVKRAMDLKIPKSRKRVND